MARKDMLMFFKSVVFGVVDFISDFRLLIFCLMSTTVEIQYYGVAMTFVMLGCMVTSAVGLSKKEEKRWLVTANVSTSDDTEQPQQHLEVKNIKLELGKG